MTINPNISRYRDLLSLLPGGDWYSSDGVVVPSRSSPYVLRYTTNKPNQQWGVFVNAVYQGLVKSDNNGNLVVGVNLQLGENVVSVVDSFDQEKVTSFLTSRVYATWFAAYAEQIETIDDYIDTVRLDSCLALCFAQDLESVWGNRLGQGNPSYESDTYRNVLSEILQAQRLFGAKLHGMEVGVAAFTQVPPLDYFRRFDGNRWVLGQSFIENRHFEEWGFSNTAYTLSGVQIQEFGTFANPGAVSFSWNQIAKTLTYTDPLLGPKTVTIDPTRSGAYSFDGTEFPAALVSLPGPFVITLGVNDSLQIDVDKKGLIDITLPAGVQTGAAIATAINTALSSDLRYGVAYNATASVFGGSVRFRLISPVSGRLSSLIIYPSSSVSTLLGIATTDLPLLRKGFTDTILTVNVVTASLPLVNTITNFVVSKSPLPSWWLVIGGSAALNHQQPKLLATTASSLVLSSLGPDVTLRRKVLSEADTYKGFEFYLNSWISTLSPGVTVFFGASFDGGSTWVESAGVPLTQADDPFVQAVQSGWKFIYDPDSTDFWIRLRFTGGGPAFSVTVDDVQFVQEFVSAAYTKLKTVPRYRHRSFFGHLLWGWSPVRLSAFEQESVGFAPFSFPRGQVDKLSAGHTSIDRFDVTEYDIVTSIPLNLKGVVNELDWSMTSLTNLRLVARTPTRFSYVESVSDSPVTTEQLVFPTTPPYNAILPLPSDQDLTGSILFEDGLPLEQSKWSYVDATTINVVNGSFVSNAVYTLRYQPLLRAESDVIDLGNTWSDYVWYADYHMYQRFTAETTELSQESVLFLDFGSFTATLDRPANIDTNAATVIRDDGIEKVELPRGSWAWLSPLIISFDGAVIQRGAIYTLRYKEIGQKHEPVMTPVFEVRSGANPAAVLLASYKEISRNTPIKTHSGNRYHQLRITLKGLSNANDFRLSSLCFKGLNAFGLNGTIPGLR